MALELPALGEEVDPPRAPPGELPELGAEVDAVAPPAPVASPEEERATRIGRVKTIFETFGADNVDQKAERIALRRRTKLPQEIVESQYPLIRQRFEAAGRDHARFVDENPDLVELLMTDRDAAQVALHDDKIRWLGNVLGAAITGVTGYTPIGQAAGEFKALKAAWELPEGTPLGTRWAVYNAEKIAGAPTAAAASALLAPVPKTEMVEDPSSKLRGLDRWLGGAGPDGQPVPGLIASAWRRGWLQQDLSAAGRDYLQALVEGRDTYQVEQRIAGLEQRQAAGWYGDDLASLAVGQGVEQLPFQLETYKWGLPAAALAAGGTLAATKNPALARKAWKVGGALGGWTGSFRAEAGLAALELRDVRTQDGRPLDPGVQVGAAVTYAALAGAVEVGAEFGPVLSMLGPMGKALQGAEGKAVRAELLRDVRWRTIMRRVGAEFARGWGAEAGEEGVQAALQEAVTYLARVGQGGVAAEAGRFDLAGSVQRIGGEAAGGFVGMAGHAIGAGTVNLASRAQARGAAMKSAVVAQVIADGAASPTATASPDGFAQLVAAQTERYGQKVDALYADPTATARLFQGDGPELEAGVLTQAGAAAAREVLGEAGPARLVEALATGTPLRIELSEMVEIAKRPELQAALLDHLAIAPGIPTQAQLVVLDKQAEAQAKEFADAVAKEETALADAPLLPEEAFFAALEEQAVKAGRMSQGEAKKSVLQARAFLRTMAATASKAGPVPLATMIDRYRVRIETEFGVVPTEVEARAAAEAAPDAVEPGQAEAARVEELRAKEAELTGQLAALSRAQSARPGTVSESGRHIRAPATPEEVAQTESLRTELAALRDQLAQAEVAQEAAAGDASFDPALFQEMEVAVEFWGAQLGRSQLDLDAATVEVEAGGDDVGARLAKEARDRARAEFARAQAKLAAYRAAFDGDFDAKVGALAENIAGSIRANIARAVEAHARATAARSVGALEQAGARTPRGWSTRVREGTRNLFRVILTKDANLSTFLHESAHVYFDILGDLAGQADASDRVKNQWAAVLKFTGLTGLEDVQSRLDGARAIDKAAAVAGRLDRAGRPELTAAERAARRDLVEPLEKFARAFEVYLMEGRAPSEDLVGAFQAFRLWLLDIYRSVAGLRVELNDEIRRTFDTMLATDEEIDRLRDFVDPESPFRSPEEAGMTGPEWAEHLKSREAAVQHARLETQAKALRARKRELDAWWRAEWTKRRAAAVKDHARLPAVELAAWLRTGQSENPVLKALTEGVRAAARHAYRPFKMSMATTRLVAGWEKEIAELEKEGGKAAEILALRERIVERIGVAEVEAAAARAAPKIPLQLAVKVLGPEKAKDALRGLTDRSAFWLPATDLALVAQTLGFADPEAMVRALADRPDRDTWAEEQADEGMARDHADVAGERSWVARQAAVELHGDAMLQWLLREWAILRKQLDEETGKRLEAIGAGSGGVAGEAVRRAAVQILERKPIGTVRPGGYLRAEQRAATDMGEAVARKDYARAYVLMQQRLLNYHLFREGQAVVEERDELEAVAKALRKPSARARLGKANPLFRDASDLVLEALGLGGPFGQDPHPASVEKAVQAMEADGATVLFDADELSRLVHRPPPAPLGANGRYQPTWKALTVLQARNVTGALKSLMAAATSKNTAIVAGKRVERESLLLAMIAEAESNRPHQGEVSSSVPAEGLVDRIGGAASAVDGDLLRPETMVRWLGGGKTNSAWVQALIQPLRNAKHEEARILREAIAPIVKAMEAMPEAAKARLGDPVDGKKLFPHHISQISAPTRRFEVLMMLLNLGNESNEERLTKGRSVTKDEVLAAAKTLQFTAAELDWVQAVWDSAESLWPMSRALEERDSGLAPPKIKASPITINGRTLRGGYFPAVYDRRVAGTGEMQAGDSVAGMMDPTYTRPGTHHSHLKKRAGRFDDVISLDPSVIQGHLWQVAHDIAFREAVRSVAGLLLDRGAAAKVEGGVEVSPARPPLKDVLVQRLGEKRAGYFLQWAKDVASHRGAQVTPHAKALTRLLAKLRQNATVGLLGYAADIAIGDLANVPTGYARFHKLGMHSKHLWAGVAEYLRHPLEVRAWVLGKSGELRSRADGALEDWKRTQATLLRRRGGARKVLKGWDSFIDHAFVFFEWTEAFSATPIWVGAYRWGISQGHSETEAVQHADHVAASLLPPRHPMDMPAVMRDKGVVGGVSFLYGYLNTIYNLRRDVLDDAYLAAHTSELEGKAPDWRRDAVAVAKVLPAVAWRLFALVVAYQLLGEILTGRGPEDEDRDGGRDAVDWALWALRKMLSGLTVNDLPFGAMAEPAITKAVTGKASRMSVRQVPGMSVLQGLGDAVLRAAGGDELGADQAYDILRALGVAGGAPTRPLRAADYVRRSATGEADVRGPGDVLGGIIYGERWGDPANPFTAAQDLVE